MSNSHKSPLTGVELSTKSEILSVIINDECQSVSKENVEVGDCIFTSFMREGEEHIQFVGQVTRVKTGIFGKTYFFEHNGQEMKFNEKDFINACFYRRENIE